MANLRLKTWAATALYPVSANPWSATATVVVPPYTYRTPNTTFTSEHHNFFYKALVNNDTALEICSTQGAGRLRYDGADVNLGDVKTPHYSETLGCWLASSDEYVYSFNDGGDTATLFAGTTKGTFQPTYGKTVADSPNEAIHLAQQSGIPGKFVATWLTYSTNATASSSFIPAAGFITPGQPAWVHVFWCPAVSEFVAAVRYWNGATYNIEIWSCPNSAGAWTNRTASFTGLAATAAAHAGQGVAFDYTTNNESFLVSADTATRVYKISAGWTVASNTVAPVTTSTSFVGIGFKPDTSTYYAMLAREADGRYELLSSANGATWATAASNNLGGNSYFKCFSVLGNTLVAACEKPSASGGTNGSKFQNRFAYSFDSGVTFEMSASNSMRLANTYSISKYGTCLVGNTDYIKTGVSTESVASITL